MNKIEFLHNIDKYKGEDHSTFLQHYGILGQKWGQRRWQNPDGTFNEEGKQRYFGKNGLNSSIHEEKLTGIFSKKPKDTSPEKIEADKIEDSLKDGKKISWNKVTDFVESDRCNQIRKDFDEKFKDIYQDQQNELNDLFEDYNKEAYSYRAKAGILNQLYAGNGDTVEDLAYMIRLYTWDDLDQGCNSSQYVYMQDKGYNDDQIREMSKQDDEKFDQLKDISRQLVEEDPVLNKMSDKAKEEIADRINWNKMIGDENYGHWLLNDADEGAGFDKGEHRDEMNKIYDKLQAAGNEDYGNGWWNLTQAVRNLKLDDKKYTELTDADWDAINAEVRELNKLGSSSKIGSWDQEKHMEEFRNWQEVSKKVKMPGGDVRAIYDSNEEYYDDDAKHVILKNAKLIRKMDKALEKGDTNKYMKLRNNIEDDYEKDLIESFVENKRTLDNYNDTISDLNKSFKKKGIDVNVSSYDDTEIYYENGRRSAYESDFIKHPENIKKYKDTCENILNNYDKFNQELVDKLGDRYYKAYLSTVYEDDKPLTKEQFKKTFEKATGTIYPASQGNGATFEGEIDSYEYGGDLPSTYLFFSYDLLNKTFDYIEEE